MKNTVKVRKEGHHRPHAEFYHAAWVHLEHVKEKRDGYFYSLLSAFMMTAFTLEAYLNYVGPIVESGWNDFDKSSPLAKLRHVACAVGLKLDSSRRPIQSIINLFAFRNQMAHPRASHVVEEHLATPEDYQKYLHSEPKPKWMAYATHENALICHKDVGDIIESINSKLPAPESTLMNMMWTGSAISVEENVQGEKQP